MGDAIRYLYRQLILRDVLSFVTPGAIVVFTATYLWHSSIPYDNIHWLLYIPIFGLFYMVGFAAQCLGELFGIIRFTPYGERSWGKRWRVFCCNFTKNYPERSENKQDSKDREESNIWWWEEEEELSKFYDKAEQEEGIKQGHERLVVLKQMCANGFATIFIAATLIAFHHFRPDEWRWLLLFWSVMLLVALFWGYRVHMLKQYTREKVFMDRREKQ
jgi:hypothetical protein